MKSLQQLLKVPLAHTNGIADILHAFTLLLYNFNAKYLDAHVPVIKGCKQAAATGDYSQITSFLKEYEEDFFALLRAKADVLEKTVPLVQADEIMREHQKRKDAARAGHHAAIKKDSELCLAIDYDRYETEEERIARQASMDEIDLQLATQLYHDGMIHQRMGFQGSGETVDEIIATLRSSLVEDVIVQLEATSEVEYDDGEIVREVSKFVSAPLFSLPKESIRLVTEHWFEMRGILDVGMAHTTADHNAPQHMRDIIFPIFERICTDMAKRYFPGVSIIRIQKESRNLIENREARWQKMEDEYRAKLMKLFPIPHIDDDRWYMRVHDLVREQKEKFEALESTLYSGSSVENGNKEDEEDDCLEIENT